MYIKYTKNDSHGVSYFSDDVTIDEIDSMYGHVGATWVEITQYEYDKFIAARQIINQIRKLDASTIRAMRSVLLGVPTEQDYQLLGDVENEYEDFLKELSEFEESPHIDTSNADAMLAKINSGKILTSYMQKQVVQTANFTPIEFYTFAKSGLFDAWQPGTFYEAGKRIAHGGVVYETQLEHTSQAHQVPGGEGMLAIYRPISADPETGIEPDGTLENPYVFLYGMDAFSGKYFKFEGHIYLAKADMIPCVWNPGTAGLWQWELVQP